LGGRASAIPLLLGTLYCQPSLSLVLGWLSSCTTRTSQRHQHGSHKLNAAAF
jgi:hypothetical protein